MKVTALITVLAAATSVSAAAKITYFFNLVAETNCNALNLGKTESLTDSCVAIESLFLLAKAPVAFKAQGLDGCKLAAWKNANCDGTPDVFDETCVLDPSSQYKSVERQC